MSLEAINSNSGHYALELNADSVAEWAAKHPSWYIFPAKVVPRDDEPGSWSKHPLVKWRDSAVSHNANGAEAIKQLWRSKVGSGIAAVAVACAPSGIWVLDEDHEVPEESDWHAILAPIIASRLTLVLRSCTKQGHHYVFTQPSDPKKWVSEGKWETFGEVKASGYVIVSKLEPFVNTKPQNAPQALLDKLKIGIRRGKGGLAMATNEGMWEWILEGESTETLLSYEAGQKFLNIVTTRLETNVYAGEHRRMATLTAVFTAAKEAASGFYTPMQAYQGVRDAYIHLRDRDGSWNTQRSQDYDNMWSSLIPAIQAGIFDEEIDANRLRVGDDISLDDLEMFENLVNSWGFPSVEEEELGYDNNHANNIANSDPINSPNNSGIAQGVEHTSVSGIKERAWDALDPNATLPKKPVLTLGEDAYWGPYGDFLVGMRGLTEATDIGILAALLGHTGTLLGGRGYLWKDAYHGPNVFPLLIGTSGKARKSTALNLVNQLIYGNTGNTMEFLSEELGGTPYAMSHAAELCNEWPRQDGGIASGQMLTHRLGPIHHKLASKEEEDYFTYPNPRTVIHEHEMSQLWKATHKDGANMTETICSLWDGSRLANHALTSGSKTVPIGRHICSILGASTLTNARLYCNTVDATSGFGNRFLWFWLPHSELRIPRPQFPPHAVLSKFRGALFDAIRRWPSYGGGIWEPDIRYPLSKYDINTGVSAGDKFMVHLDDDAENYWDTAYLEIDANIGPEGLITSELCARAVPHVLRLALNYQMMVGGTKVTVQALKTGRAVWEYCQASVQEIFGEMTGSADIDDLVAYLVNHGGWSDLMSLKNGWKSNGMSKILDDAVKGKILVEGQSRQQMRGMPNKFYKLRSFPQADLGAECSKLRLSEVTWAE